METQPTQENANPTPPAVAPKPEAPAFAFTNAEFEAHAARFQPVTLPQAFPLPDAVVQEIKKRPVADEARDRYLCNTGFFDCSIAEKRNEFFCGARFQISPQAIGLVYYGIGDHELQFVLMTYDTAGKPVAGIILAGEFGDVEWGFSAEISVDKVIQRTRYVWVEGTEKEYVKDQWFRLNPAGGIEETI